MASLSLKGVTKVYPNGFIVVEDFNLDVVDKELVVFAGPSGCGKSTTLRMIAGLEDVSSGELYIDSKLVNNIEPKDRDITMIFQNYALYPYTFVYDDMALSLRLGKTPKDEIDKLVQGAARVPDLIHLLDREPKALSSGQEQRVTIGRVIVRSLGAFLVDKPLSNSDARLEDQVRIGISKLRRRLEATIICIAHDQTEAMTLGTRVVAIKDGTVQQIDPPQNLYDKPCNEFTAGPIGASQMSLVDATVGKGGSDVTLTFGGHAIAIPAERGKKLENDGYVGKAVTLDIHPEDLYNGEAFLASSPGSVINATIRAYGPLGAKVYLYFDASETNFAAKVNSRTIARVDDAVKLGLDLNKIYVFNKEAEKAVLN